MKISQPLRTFAFGTHLNIKKSDRKFQGQCFTFIGKYEN